jgi:hypothetical protein
MNEKDPFGVGDSGDDLQNPLAGELYESQYPTLDFELVIKGTRLNISTSNNDIFGTKFDHPAEVDNAAGRLSELRVLVYEGYLTVRSARKKRERLFDNLVKQWKNKLVDQIEGRYTNDKMDALILKEHGKEYNDGMLEIEQLKIEEERLLNLHETVTGRAYVLRDLADRFSKEFDAYFEIFSKRQNKGE